MSVQATASTASGRYSHFVDSDSSSDEAEQAESLSCDELNDTSRAAAEVEGAGSPHDAADSDTDNEQADEAPTTPGRWADDLAEQMALRELDKLDRRDRKGEERRLRPKEKELPAHSEDRAWRFPTVRPKQHAAPDSDSDRD